MKREIKFRAWNGSVIKPVERLDMFHHGTNGPWTVLADEYEVQVMQYTGLKDKNEVEIYEGDWIQIKNVRQTEVVMEGFVKEDIAGGGYRLWKDSKWTTIFPINIFCRETSSQPLEVIGNIYQNPELIK